MTTPGVQKAPPNIDPKALEVIAQNHYTNALSAPETARTRAQAAYTVASAAAAALVTAGAIGDIQSFPGIVQLLGGAALVAWVICAALFVEVSRKSGSLGSAKGENLQPNEFATRALQSAKSAADIVDKRLTKAILGSWIALGLTATTFLSTLVFPSEPATTDVTLILSKKGARVASDICGSPTESLTGELREGTLDDAYAVIEVDAGTCQEDETTVLLAPSHISGVVSDDEDAPVFPWNG